MAARTFLILSGAQEVEDQGGLRQGMHEHPVRPPATWTTLRCKDQGQEREYNLLTLSDRIAIPMVAVEIFNYLVNCAANYRNIHETNFWIVFVFWKTNYHAIFYVFS